MTGQAFSFGTAAASYDRFRPRYPDAAVRWAVDHPPPARVVDLAAGTGILTRSLLALGHHVVPVEPDEGMRIQLVAVTPGVTAVAGRAEEIPLSGHAVDAIITGQAYHWFDREQANAEAGRVIRPGGTFTALWNLRDDSAPWVAELSRIVGAAPGYRGVHNELPEMTAFGELFAAPQLAEFRHRTMTTPEALLGMVRTRSYHLTATARRRAQLDRAVRELLADHPDLTGRDKFELPYRTVCYRARRS